MATALRSVIWGWREARKTRKTKHRKHPTRAPFPTWTPAGDAREIRREIHMQPLHFYLGATAGTCCTSNPADVAELAAVLERLPKASVEMMAPSHRMVGRARVWLAAARSTETVASTDGYVKVSKRSPSRLSHRHVQLANGKLNLPHRSSVPLQRKRPAEV